MNISGTLHLYSGHRGELFFVFDDDVAQVLYGMTEFDLTNADTRRVWVSIGSDRFINRRTLSFSQKQSEIKVSLCSLGSKDDLGALTVLYDWFLSHGGTRPPPLPVLGELRLGRHHGLTVWELSIVEPVGVVLLPGLSRRSKRKSQVRKAWRKRREIQDRELAVVGRAAEELAFELAQDEFCQPRYECLWRDNYLDSARDEIRRLGIIADIDVWDVEADSPACIVEVKAQKTARPYASPQFYLSGAEWRSFQTCSSQGIPYRIWLFQYRAKSDLESNHRRVNLIVYDELDESWLDHEDNYIVKPISNTGTHYDIQ